MRIVFVDEGSDILKNFLLQLTSSKKSGRKGFVLYMRVLVM